MAGHVFISHGSENRDEANELCAFIEARGVKCWIAPRDVRPGIDYSEELQAAIENAAAFVVLVTDHSNRSPYVRAETEMAFSSHKPIFPVRQADIKPAAGLALFLKIRHWTDAYGKYRDGAMDRLALELQTVTGVAATSPAPVPAAPPLAPSPPPAPAPPPAPTPAPAPPLAAASAPAAPEPAPVAGAGQERLEAAIGPNAAWYLARWQEMDARRSQLTWNWAACLTNLLWFGYRKMWVPTAAFFLVVVALAVLGMLSTPLMIAGGVLTVLAITATGALGTSVYRQHVARLVARTGGMEREVALTQLRASGGVSPAAVILLAVLAIAATGGAAWLIRPAQTPVTPPAELPNGLSPRVGDSEDPSPGITPGLAPGSVPGIGPNGEVDEEALRNAIDEARNLLEQQGQGRDPLGEALSVPSD
jgi:hypothetical protein